MKLTDVDDYCIPAEVEKLVEEGIQKNVIITNQNEQIAELVEMLEYLKNKPVIRMLDWDDVGRLIDKYRKKLG